MAQSFRDLMTLRNDPPPMLRRALGALGIAVDQIAGIALPIFVLGLILLILFGVFLVEMDPRRVRPSRAADPQREQPPRPVDLPRSGRPL